MSGGGYRVLGEIAVDGRAVTRRRERELFALLVAARGRPVAVERIVDEIWSAEGERAAVQVAVSRLRALLDPTRSGPVRVATSPAGYQLAAAMDEVDAWVFEDLAERALAAPTAADRLVLGTRATELWAGAPYAECQAPSLRAEATRLAELHLTVQESRAEALLELGHPAAAVRLLAPVAPEHPYREQLWALLARSQYACARQADALATLAELRSRLAEDLGVDPSSVVRSMEQAILAQDPGLTPVAPARAAPSVAHGRVRVGRGSACSAVDVRWQPPARPHGDARHHDRYEHGADQPETVVGGQPRLQHRQADGHVDAGPEQRADEQPGQVASQWHLQHTCRRVHQGLEADRQEGNCDDGCSPAAHDGLGPGHPGPVHQPPGPLGPGSRPSCRAPDGVRRPAAEERHHDEEDVRRSNGYVIGHTPIVPDTVGGMMTG